MIAFADVSKILGAGRMRTLVLNKVTLQIPMDRKIALLGHQGSGKSTVISLIAGLTLPTQGKIRSNARIGFPLGFAGGFRSRLTLRQNLMHLAKLYGANAEEVMQVVSSVSSAPQPWDELFGKVPQQLRVEFIYAVGYCMPFDVYLFDNTIAVGSSEFRQKCLAMFEARASTAGFILATRDVRIAKRHADMGIIVSGGKLTLYETLDEATEQFAALPQHSQAMIADVEAE
jgi:capsular polysaccharide transport system ATP-binding protein